MHLVVKDNDNPDNRKFICDKTNIGSKPLARVEERHSATHTRFYHRFPLQLPPSDGDCHTPLPRELMVELIR